MRKTVLAIIAAALPAFAATAGQPGHQKPAAPATSGKLLPLKGATSANPCAAHGAGFVKVEGTETCVRIGGAVSVDAGGSRGLR
ncbi:porin [Bradyrhizobium sp.]|uniref:porin n=1 Tax=Bradyrhizobium sp. TaxID=376 RepID=UPI003C729988